MALDLFQELRIIKGEEGPTGSPLSELVYQGAIGEGLRISTAHKQFDEGANAEAASYLSKIRSVASQVARKNQATLDSLVKILVSLIGDEPSITWTQVQNADDAAWEGFVTDQIDECFEIMGGVTIQEKAAYDALP